MATGSDTTNLQPVTNSPLLYANDSVGKGRGLRPTPTQHRLGCAASPLLPPHTHTYQVP